MAAITASCLAQRPAAEKSDHRVTGDAMRAAGQPGGSSPRAITIGSTAEFLSQADLRASSSEVSERLAKAAPNNRGVANLVETLRRAVKP
jgi:hypothetical protein